MNFLGDSDEEAYYAALPKAVLHLLYISPPKLHGAWNGSFEDGTGSGQLGRPDEG